MGGGGTQSEGSWPRSKMQGYFPNLCRDSDVSQDIVLVLTKVPLPWDICPLMCILRWLELSEIDQPWGSRQPSLASLKLTEIYLTLPFSSTGTKGVCCHALPGPISAFSSVSVVMPE